VKRIQQYIGNETFMLTYGDGVADIDLKALVEYHRNKGKYATITAVQPSGKFGALNLSEDGTIKSFIEKPVGDGGWVNGGFMVMKPEVFDYIKGDETVLEREPLENLAKDGQLCAYKHRGFWQPMDTMRDKNTLESLWSSGKAPWKIWN